MGALKWLPDLTGREQTITSNINEAFMAGSVNKVIILGNLGKDPEARSLNSGDKCTNLSVAVSESWKDRQTGEKKEKTEWVRVVLFGPPAEIAEKYLAKGSKVYVEGKLQTRKWTDNAGVERYSTEVVVQGFGGQLVLLGGKGEGGGASSGGAQSGGYNSASSGANAGPPVDDEIPF